MSKTLKWVLIIAAVTVAIFIIWRRRMGNDSDSNGIKISKKITPKDYAASLSQQFAEESEYQAIATNDDAFYNKLASDLYAAMKGAGTREDEVFSIFERYIKTNADLERLVTAFDKRKGKYLATWLQDELNNKEETKLNQMLRDNGIGFSIENMVPHAFKK